MRVNRLLAGVALLAALAAQRGLAEEPARPGFHPLGGPPPSKECAAGYEALLAGDLADAAKEFAVAAARKPAEGAACFGLGLIAQLNGERQLALEHFSRALSEGCQDAWAEVYLRAAAMQLADGRDPQPFLAAAQAVEARPDARPYLKDWLRYCRARWLLARGAYAEAAEAAAPLQFLRTWALSGPFDNRDKSGFDKVYPPEEEADFEKSAAGRNRPVAWFRPAAQPPLGEIELNEMIEPATHSLAYGVTHVKAAQAQWAVLHVGAGGALKVWLNEREVAKIAEYNDFAPQKLSVPVYLHAGWNQVRVKSAVGEGGTWSFALRLARPEGGPLEGVVVDSSAAALKAYRAESPGRSTPLLEPASPELGLLPRLRAALKGSPDDAFLHAIHGHLLDSCNLGEKQERLAAAEFVKALERCPRCPLFRLQLAGLEGDRNQARQAAETCHKDHPDLPLPYVFLTQIAARSGLDLSAEGYAREALAKFSPARVVPCALELADILENRHELAEAERLAAAAVEARPFAPEGWALRAGLALSRRDRRALLEKALGFCGGDALLRGQWGAQLIEQGKEDEAAKFAEAELAAWPFAVSKRLALARAWRRAGDGARERAALDQARAVAPENPELLQAAGAAALFAGKSDEAAALWQEALRVKPDAPAVKDWLAEISQGAVVDKGFFAPYDVSYRELPQPQAADYPSDHSITLLNQEVVHVNPNGSASRMVHLVAKLLRQDGAAGLQRHRIFYEPARQVIDILRAAVITPAGSETSRAEIADRTVSAAMGVQTRIYDEYHLKEVVFRDLEPGAIIDLQYIQRDTGGNVYGDFFSAMFQLADDQPVARSEYTLDLPKTREFQMRAYRMTLEPRRLESKDPNREVFQWACEKAPGVAQERFMPPLDDQLPFVQVTTMKTWQEVATWYWNLAKDQVVADEELRRVVAEITRDAAGPSDKLRAVHDWVIKKIRYLGIEFGRNGYKPHRAMDTCKALYGDCKDTAALVVAMLQAAGIEAKLVLVRAVTSGKIEGEALPAPNLFNHCIAYVPDVEGREYWIDGTTDYHQLGELPYTDQGAQVLVVGPDGGRFVQIPKATAEENRGEQRFEAQVAKGGDGTLLVRYVHRGQFAPYFRELAETPGRFKSLLQEQAARRFPGAELTRLNHASANEPGPMWIEAEYKVPALAAVSGDRRTLAAAPQALDLARRYLTGGTRKHDLEIWFPWARSSEVAYHLDPAWRPVSLPEEADLKEEFASFRRQVSVEGQTVRIRDAFVFSSQRVPKDVYDKFSDFCHKVDALLDQKVLLQGQ